MKIPAKYKKILSDIMDKAQQNNVKVTISKEKHIKYPIGGFPVHGYFAINAGYPNGELGISTGDGLEEWIKVLIHESCHMDQFIENDYVWTNNFIYDCKDHKIKESIDLLDEWTNGRNFSKSIITDLTNSVLNVELDCEKRSAEKMKRYNLDINIDVYTQQSNSYIYFYRFLEVSRAWYTKTPYQIKKVWSKMPKTFNNDYSKVSNEYKNIYKSLL